MFYDAIQQMSHLLKNLIAILEKAEAHAEANKFDSSNLLSARLAPDMFTLTRQIQAAADHAKFAACRLSGREAPRNEDTEASLAELRARLQSTVELLGTFGPGDFDGAAEREVRLSFIKGQHLTGRDYFLQFAQPNFYFHLTAAYTILRHNGVKIGKMDFLGHINLRPDA